MAYLSLVAILVTVMSIPASAQASGMRVAESLAFSCLGKPFVRASAMTQHRDGFPNVQLTLTDPLGRIAGEEPKGGERIPDSSYGKIVEMPGHPEYSKARAVEVVMPSKACTS